MMFRKIALTLLTVTLGTSWAYAKKAPKFEQAHQFTPEQAALVQKAIAQEKVLIKAIQQRTPLVETYIQDTRPDVKLYQVPVGRPIHAQPRRLRQGLLRQDLRDRKDAGQEGILQGIVRGHHRADQGAGSGQALHLQSHRLHADDVPRSRPASTSSTTCSAMCAASFWDRCAPGSSMCTPRSRAWAASTAASGLKTRTAMWSASTAPTPARRLRTIRATTSTSTAGA